MKIIYTLIIVLNSIHSFSQDEVLFVKYEKLINQNSKETQLCWINDSFILSQKRSYAGEIKKLFVVDEGIWTSDTIKYKQYFEDSKKGKLESINHINERAPINKRYINSNIINRYQTLGQITETKYIVIDTLKPMDNWQIHEDTIHLLGLVCQKATFLLNYIPYEAYFCARYPYSVGPNNFRGLPGIILKVTNTNTKDGYLATEIEYPYQKQIPKLFENGKVISQKEFLSLIEIENNTTIENLNKIKSSLEKKN